MVVVRKKYEYLQPHEEQQEKVIKKKKNLNNYKVEKIIFTFSIALVFVLSLLLLTRFATITQIRHQINSLNNQLEQLKTQKEHLKIKVETVSKSRWIEKEAIERLGMQYPLPEQVIYIHVPPTEIAILSNELNNFFEDRSYTDTVLDKTINKIFYKFHKIVGWFRI